MPGPALETARLILRPPLEEDLDGWAELMGDAEAARFIGGFQPRAIAWRGLASMAGSWTLMATACSRWSRKRRSLGRPAGPGSPRAGLALGRWALVPLRLGKG